MHFFYFQWVRMSCFSKKYEEEEKEEEEAEAVKNKGKRKQAGSEGEKRKEAGSGREERKMLETHQWLPTGLGIDSNLLLPIIAASPALSSFWSYS